MYDLNEPISSRQCYADIHCHCLPGIDDGPTTMAEAIHLCRALVSDGIRTAIATPHQLGRYDNTNSNNQIREAVLEINEKLRENDIDLHVLPGADVRIDERIFDLIEGDKIMTLCDRGRYLLLELVNGLFIDIEPLLAELKRAGISAIISHPERNSALVKQQNVIEQWLDYPVHFQITAGSLLGEFGQSAQKAAWSFLNHGWAQIVATDAHDVCRRSPCMAAAFERIAFESGPRVAREVCIENPMLISRGAELSRVSEVSTSGYSYGGAYN